MIRKIVIVAFIIFLSTSLYTYFHSKRGERIVNSDSFQAPPFIFTQAKIRRYNGNVLESKLRAKNGFFAEPNLLHLEGSVSATRYSGDEVESVKSVEAVAFLDVEKLADIFGDPELTRIELKTKVRVGVKNHLILTDYAEYLTETNVIETLDPVKVKGQGKFLQGNEGFRFDLNQKSLLLFGDVTGVMKFDEDPIDQN